MRIRKKLLAALAVPLFLPLLMASSCGGGNGSGDTQEHSQQQSDTTQMELILPLPHFDYSAIRYELIVQEAVQAFGISSTTFFFNQGEREPIDQCASVGLPIPADASLSNPWQPLNATDGNGNYNTVAVGQMDPNGFYQGPTSATYVLCKTATGGTYMVHAEEFVHAVTAQAYWDPKMYGGKGGIHVVGDPQVPVCTDIRKTTYKDNNGDTQHGYESLCYRPGHVPAGVHAPNFGT